MEITEAEFKRFELLKQSLRLITHQPTGERHFWAARMYGLTAYGDTEDVAIERLKQMLSFRVDAERRWNAEGRA